MRDNPLVLSHDEVLATEVLEFAIEVAVINKTNRPTRASKRAPEKPTVSSVSFANTTSHVDDFAPPEAQTEATPEAQLEQRLQPQAKPNKSNQKQQLSSNSIFSHSAETVIEPKTKSKTKKKATC